MTLSCDEPEITHVGVVGAGQMGLGIALSASQAGLRVSLVDHNPKVLAQIPQRARQQHRQARFLGLATQPLDALLARIALKTELSSLQTAHFIFENIREQTRAKQTLFANLDALCPRHTIFASNTSAIPIHILAQTTKRAPQVIGTHFMNPAFLKPAVELAYTPQNSQATQGRTLELLGRMGKTPIAVEDGPGFVNNRILMLTILEAIRLVSEQRPPQQIDRVMTSCLGHPTGPLATADLIGLDVILDTLYTLQEYVDPVRYQPCELLLQMVQQGKLGKKTGQGFYSYTSPFSHIPSRAKS